MREAIVHVFVGQALDYAVADWYDLRRSMVSMLFISSGGIEEREL